MKTADTSNSACGGIPLAGPNGGAWPPAWLKSAETVAVPAVAELPSPPADEPLPAIPLPHLALPTVAACTTPRPAQAVVRCARCSCRDYIDIPIHGGQSIRRDCARCGRLLDFPLWYGVADGVPG